MKRSELKQIIKECLIEEGAKKLHLIIGHLF
jgi:hypothetical protein